MGAEPLYDELQMKVHLLLQEKNELEKEIRSINLEPFSIGKDKRLSNRIDRLKYLMQRISRLGRKYNIVKVWGSYAVKSHKLVVGKKFEMYFTDISTEDARRLVELIFADGVMEVHTEHIEPGTIIETKYF